MGGPAPSTAHAMEPKREPAIAPEPPPEEMRAPVVLRPTPTLATSNAMGRGQPGSTFQIPPFSRSPVEPLTFQASLGLPHPARSWPGSAQGPGGAADGSRLVRAQTEDELAASTMDSLIGRRDDVAGPAAGPGHQVPRPIPSNGSDGNDGIASLGGQAQQKALMQQQQQVRRFESRES